MIDEWLAASAASAAIRFVPQPHSLLGLLVRNQSLYVELRLAFVALLSSVKDTYSQ